MCGTDDGRQVFYSTLQAVEGAGACRAPAPQPAVFVPFARSATGRPLFPDHVLTTSLPPPAVNTSPTPHLGAQDSTC